MPNPEGSLPLKTSTDLYCGTDLRNAAEKSGAALPVSGALHGMRNAFGILGDVVRYRHRTNAGGAYRFVVADGTPPNRDERLTAAFAGSDASLDWCLSSVFGSYTVVESQDFASAAGLAVQLDTARRHCNIVFAERPPRAPAHLPAGTSVSLPAWVRQRVAVHADWRSQIDGLRRRTRQEMARVLRRHRYGCRLTRLPQDFNEFYDRLYLPHIRARHGGRAIIVDRERFLRECNRGAALQLTRDGTVIGAELLRRIGNSMAVVWMGLDHNTPPDRRQGATDAMDYFSLLYASLAQCQWLDFGRSRPDLYDGTLRYKRKWGAELTRGLVPQASIELSCSGVLPSELDFLRRHAFLSRAGRGFCANLLVDEAIDAPCVQRLQRTIATRGVIRLRIATLSGIDADARQIERDSGGTVVLHAIRSVHDAMRVFSD